MAHIPSPDTWLGHGIHAGNRQSKRITVDFIDLLDIGAAVSAAPCHRRLLFPRNRVPAEECGSQPRRFHLSPEADIAPYALLATLQGGACDLPHRAFARWPFPLRSGWKARPSPNIHPLASRQLHQTRRALPAFRNLIKPFARVRFLLWPLRPSFCVCVFPAKWRGLHWHDQYVEAQSETRHWLLPSKSK